MEGKPDKRMLVVEDAPNWQKLIVEFLQEIADARDWKAQIVIAGSFGEALACLATTSFDCITIDNQLQDGEVANILLGRINHLNPKVPVVVVSGVVDPKNVRDFFKDYQIDEFFWKKDFDPKEFKHTLERLLSPERLPSPEPDFIFNFFKAAGLRPSIIDEPDGYMCEPDTSWQTKIKGKLYISIATGESLDVDAILRTRDLAGKASDNVTHAIVLVDKPVQDGAWLQIAALRAKNLNVMPIPLTLLSDLHLSGKGLAESIVLADYLERFLGQGFDPYDVRLPVFDALSFFGREALATDLANRLMAGQAIGLFGLRKMGKSSLMRYMQRSMPCPTAWLDLQAGMELDALYERILDAWDNDARGRLGHELGLGDLKSDSKDTKGKFFRVTQEALHKLAAKAAEPRLAVFLDEIDFEIDSGRGLERYLSLTHTLRGLIQEYRQVSLMVAGVDPSIYRDSRRGTEQNPLYQIMQEVCLPPLHESDCIQMVRNIGLQVDLKYSDEAARYIAQASGGHPFLARQLCSLAYTQRRQQPGKVNIESLQEAAEQFLFDPRYAAFINERGLWDEVTNAKLWGEQAARANQAILLMLARSDNRVSESALAGDEPAKRRSALYALSQLWVVRKIEESSNEADPQYVIAIGLFKSWIRRSLLGLKE